MELLKAYERSDGAADGVWIKLTHGVDVKIREFGTPEFWRMYLKRVGKEIEFIDENADVDATEYVLAHYIIVSIGKGKKAETDAEKIHAVLKDPKYWAFKKEVLEASKKTEHFLAVDVPAVKKSLSSI